MRTELLRGFLCDIIVYNVEFPKLSCQSLGSLGHFAPAQFLRLYKGVTLVLLLRLGGRLHVCCFPLQGRQAAD